MNKVVISLITAVAIVAAISSYRFALGNLEHAAVPEAKESRSRPILTIATGENGKVRMIYAVVDQDGIYFGDQRVQLDIAIPFLEELAKKEKTHNVFVHITDLARYGDAMRFFTGIDRSKFYVTSFPVRPVPIGYRLPVIGVFRKLGCCWVDEANNQELL